MSDPSIHDVYNLQNELERRCHERGITLTIDEKAYTASASRGRITFPALLTPITEENFIKLKGFSIHEPLHHERSMMWDIMERDKVDGNSPLGSLYNQIEDQVMERIHCRSYYGDKKDLSKLYSNVIKNITSNLERIEQSGISLNEKDINVLTSMGVLIKSRSTWDEGTEALEGSFYNSMPQEAKDKIDSFVTKGWVDKFNAEDYDPAGTYKLAKEFYEELTGKDPNDPEAKEPEMPPMDQDGEGEEGKGDKGQKKDKKDQSISNIPWQMIQSSNHLDDESKVPSSSPSRIDWTNKTTTCFQPFPMADHEIVDLKNEGVNRYGTCRVINSANSNIFAAKLKRLLLVETRSEYEDEKSYGKISNRNVFRLALPFKGNGEWNTKIFAKRIDHNNIDTAVTVLVDWSGSMTGDKMGLAANASSKLLDVFSNVLKIPIEILAFSCKSREVKGGIVKAFKEPRTTSNEIIQRFNTFQNYSSGNADADSILWAEGRLLKRTEKRKIMLVLSDGSPSNCYNVCSSVSNDPYTGLKRVVKEIQDKKRVEIYGVGIMDENVKEFYKNYQVINDVRALESSLIELLHKQIIKGIYT